MKTYKTFFYWFKGFLQDKDELIPSDLRTLRKEMNDSETEDFIQSSPSFIQKHNTYCKFPMDCGLSTTCNSIIPPKCTKCGFQA